MQRRRPLPPRRRPAPGAAGPQLHRPRAARSPTPTARFRFITIKPGAYPWGNHHNAWRPAHIHFSLFGRAFTQRLVTQMYFPGDPLFFQDPIFNSVRDEQARERMISAFDLDDTSPEWALAYKWDIVLRADAVRGRLMAARRHRPSGPFFSICLPWPDGPHVVEPGTRGRDHPARPRARRRGRAGARRAGRDLAGRPRRHVRRRASAASAARRPTRTARWEITTLKPGPVDDGQAPHIDVSVLARGLLDRVVDAHLLRRRGRGQRRRPRAVRADRRPARDAGRRPPTAHRFDIHLQGAA